MPGRGAVPKPTRVRDADNHRRIAEFTVLSADGEIRGPDLPESIEWPNQTRALYEALRIDPVSQVLTPADWQHVIDTMALHRLMWVGEPSNAIKVAAEVRLRLNQLGVTPESRLRLRLMVAPSADEAPTSTLEELRRRQREQEQRRRRLTRMVDET
jgi:hypothetical protein